MLCQGEVKQSWELGGMWEAPASPDGFVWPPARFSPWGFWRVRATSVPFLHPTAGPPASAGAPRVLSALFHPVRLLCPASAQPASALTASPRPAGSEAARAAQTHRKKEEKKKGKAAGRRYLNPGPSAAETLLFGEAALEGFVSGWDSGSSFTTAGKGAGSGGGAPSAPRLQVLLCVF